MQNAVVSYEAIARTGRGGGRGGGGIRGSSRARSSGGFNLEGGAPSETAVIRGYDFSVLQMIADDLVYRLEEVEEIDPNSVRADAERGAPEVHVLPDEAVMFDRRLQVRNVLNAVGDTNPRGARTTVSFLTPDGAEIPIEVRNVEDPEDEGEGIAGLRQTPILGAGGTYLPLSEVSHVRRDQGRSMILRTDQSRRVIVSYRFAAEILASQPLLDAARAYTRDAISQMVLPTGYSIEIVEAEAETIYYWMIGIAALLIFMILASLFESLSAPLIILCTLPTAIIGSCWALVLSGTGLTSQEAPMALLGLSCCSALPSTMDRADRRDRQPALSARVQARARRAIGFPLARAPHFDDLGNHHFGRVAPGAQIWRRLRNLAPVCHYRARGDGGFHGVNPGLYSRGLYGHRPSQSMAGGYRLDRDRAGNRGRGGLDLSD